MHAVLLVGLMISVVILILGGPNLLIALIAKLSADAPEDQPEQPSRWWPPPDEETPHRQE